MKLNLVLVVGALLLTGCNSTIHVKAEDCYTFDVAKDEKGAPEALQGHSLAVKVLDQAQVPGPDGKEISAVQYALYDATEHRMVSVSVATQDSFEQFLSKHKAKKVECSSVR